MRFVLLDLKNNKVIGGKINPVFFYSKMKIQLRVVISVEDEIGR